MHSHIQSSEILLLVKKIKVKVRLGKYYDSVVLK